MRMDVGYFAAEGRGERALSLLGRPAFFRGIFGAYGEKMMNNDRIKKMAVLTVRLLLKSGAETYRVEDTLTFMAQAFGARDVQVIAQPTGVSYSYVDDVGTSIAQVVRIHTRSTDLAVLAKVNEISRLSTSGQYCLEDAIAALEAVQGSKPRNIWWEVLGAFLTAGFFSLLFDGSWFELLVAGICGSLARLLGLLFHDSPLSSTLQLFISSFLAAFAALLAARLYTGANESAMIIGSIMPLLPGMLFTNAIRDTVGGDLVSGVARGVEALLKSVAIAVGVGIMLALWRI